MVFKNHVHMNTKNLSRIVIVKRMKLQNTVAVDRESRLIPRKIQKPKHSLKNPSHIKKIPNMLPEI